MNRPRVGFLGTGWIGRHRMAAICASGAVTPAAIVEPDEKCLKEARSLAPDAVIASTLEDMLALSLDGVVIATPSALHARQAIAALQSGAAVFCQKPLGRDATEVQAVLTAAREADRLLWVDFSYRMAAAFKAVKTLIDDGALGRVFAADLVFHNAYGPDKPWFYDRAQSGGGCLMDLGVHLVDLLLWTLDFPEVTGVTSRLCAGGAPLSLEDDAIEDYATAELSLSSQASARIACSWRLHAGRDAIIETTFYGTEGGAGVRNVGGSFYDFEAFHWEGTSSKKIVQAPDEWGGRSAAVWAETIAGTSSFDPRAEQFGIVAQVLDRIYRCSGITHPGG